MKHDHCPDCGVGVGRKHKDGCDVERCPHCGGQALGCTGFDPSDRRREPWTGKWPGEADCERLGFFINGDRSLPDINRLFAECVWNPDRQRWKPLLPSINARTIRLLDHPRAINQICMLERRTVRGGRDSIDRPPNTHWADPSGERLAN
jgi:hypothetical protein